MSTLYQKFLKHKNSEVKQKLIDHNDELNLSDFQIWAINEVLKMENEKLVGFEVEKDEKILSRIATLNKIDDFIEESNFIEVLTDVKIYPKQIAYVHFVEFMEEKGFKINLKNRGFYKKLDEILKEYGVETKYFFVNQDDILDNFSFIKNLDVNLNNNTFSCYAIEGADLVFTEYLNRGGKK